jgi:membrane protease YdiL (CAAX protease family)
VSGRNVASKPFELLIADQTHGALMSVLLHLIPGFVAFLSYLYLFAPLSAALGFPRQMAFVWMDVFVLIPLLLGSLFYFGHAKSGRWTIDGIVLNRKHLVGRRLVTILLALFVYSAVAMAALSWTHSALVQHVFYWLPDSILQLEKTDLVGYRFPVALATRLASLVFVGVVGPIAEELYFRGFLLPRLSWMGAAASVWQAILFAGYHFLSPWDFVWRVFVLVPAIYAVQRTQSVSLSIWGHCVGNTAGELLALVALFMRR